MNKTLNLSTLAIAIFIFVAISLSLIKGVSAQTSDNQELPVEIKRQLLQGQFSKAAQQLEKLGKQNNQQAKYQLAILLLNGRGINQSVTRAQALLHESANDLPEAAFLLGSLYYKGKQIQKDDVLAKRYLTISANAGNLRATNMLSKIEAAASNSNRIKPQTQRLFELAIASGNLSLVIKQYLNGANLNHSNDKGDPPLITAMKLSRADISQWLIKQRVNLTNSDNAGNSSLHIAAKLGLTQNVVSIANKLTNIDPINTKQQTPLIIAVKNKRQSVAQWLINKGANANAKDRFGKSANDYNRTSKLNLMVRQVEGNAVSKDARLAKKQTTHQIKALKKQSLNKTSPYYGWPLLSIAIAQGQIDIAEALISKGDKPWLNNSYNDTAISLSLENEHYQLLDKMLKQHPVETQSNAKAIEKLFFIAIKKGRTNLVSQLLHRARQLGLTDLVGKGLIRAVKEQNTNSAKLFLDMDKKKPSPELLGLSITAKDFKVSKLLIDRGIALDWKDQKGRTPLIIAAQKSNSQVITLLLEKDVDIELTDSQGLTPLMWTTKRGCLTCVQLLIHRGANSEIASNIGNTAIMFAAQESNNILDLFLKSNPDLTVRNQQSQTALMLAVECDNLSSVKSLLKGGANPKRKNLAGQDSYDLAENKPAILSVLEQF